MKRKMKEIALPTAVASKWWPATLSALAIVPALVTASATALAGGSDDDARDKGNLYQQVNLVSDQAGKAILQDTNLVNAWGVSFSPTSPFWISDNGSALATLYSVTNDSAGQVHVSKVGLQVTIPGEGSPTGRMSFEAEGEFRGLLKGMNEGPIVIDGLWTLSFLSGGRAGTPDTLFFTAGPDSESHGLFGNLTPLGDAEEDGQSD